MVIPIPRLMTTPLRSMITDMLMDTEAVAAAPKVAAPAAERPKERVKGKLSFNEKREFELLGEEIPRLEAEKAALETEMSSGTLSADELMAKSERIAALIDEIDVKSMRWLELSEL